MPKEVVPCKKEKNASFEKNHHFGTGANYICEKWASSDWGEEIRLIQFKKGKKVHSPYCNRRRQRMVSAGGEAKRADQTTEKNFPSNPTPKKGR